MTPAELDSLLALADAAQKAVKGDPDNWHAGLPEWTALDEYREAVSDPDTIRALVAAVREPLDVERLAEALAFAHPGPRPWPAALTSSEFARVIARAYAATDPGYAFLCTFRSCNKREDDPVHPSPNEKMPIGGHVFRIERPR